MLLLGFGFALSFPTLNIAGTSGVGDHEQGLASGLVQTSFQVGGAIGLAVVSAIITSQAGESTDTGVILDAYRTALVVVTGVAVAGLAIALSGCSRSVRSRWPRPTELLHASSAWRLAAPRGLGIEGRECARAQAPAVVLTPQLVRINRRKPTKTRTGSRAACRKGRPPARPAAAHSLPSMML